MRIYETTFILSPQADDAAFDRQIKSVSELITSNEGKVLEEDRWGIRRLAYPIKKFTQGYYTRMVFEGTRDLLTKMDRFFRLEEPYIRYLTVQFEGTLEGQEESSSKETAAPAVHPTPKPTPKPTPEPAPVEEAAPAEPSPEPEEVPEKKEEVDEPGSFSDPSENKL